MAIANLGICNTCRGRVPSEFLIRDNEVWIRKDCPTCGPNESLVSTDAAVWQSKRDLWKYVPVEPEACGLNCEGCRIDHKPSMVFLDVTNRCNMNCPICIATIRGMGFDFNPPLEYFEKIFEYVGKLDPKPMVELFGGEPTVRDDLLDIIAIGRKHGLKPRVVTNGLRLADEDYCKRLCDASVRMRFAFDGDSPDIYEKLRHNRAAHAKKMRALENLKKHSRRKHAIISCFAWGFNDQYLAPMLQWCHDNRDLISDVGMIPLTENWEDGTFEVARRTTMEDVEKMVQAAVPGGEVEFVPAGLSYALRKPRSFFRRDSRSEVLLLGGVHPNCESMTLLVSDGKTFRSVNHYLKRPFSQVASEFVDMTRRIEPKLDRLDPAKFFQRHRGRWIILRTYVPWALRTLRIGRLLGGNLVTGLFRLVGSQLRRRVAGSHKRRRARRLLRVAMLPFEEVHSVDAARMENCKAVFAYEDAADGKVKTIPACMWYPYRNPILEKLSNKYGVVHRSGTMKTPPAAAAAAVEE